MIEGSYVGNRGTRLQVARQINSTPASYLSTSPVRDQATISYLAQNFANPFFGLSPVYGQTISRSQLLKPYPQFGNVSVTEPVGFSWYHALQLRTEKRMARGYTFQAAYTWSKLMEATSFLNPTDPIPYEGISGFDRTHRISVSGIFELPFGKGRQFAAHVPAPVNAVIGGWQLDAVEPSRPIRPPNAYSHLDTLTTSDKAIVKTATGWDIDADPLGDGASPEAKEFVGRLNLDRSGGALKGKGDIDQSYIDKFIQENLAPQQGQATIPLSVLYKAQNYLSQGTTKQ